MKTMTKRLISIVLVIMMLMTSVPFSAFATEASDNLCIYAEEEIGLYTAAGFGKLEGQNSITAYIK
jgi:hypothetical protein